MAIHLVQSQVENGDFSVGGNREITTNKINIARGLEALSGEDKLDARQLKNFTQGSSDNPTILITLASDLSSVTVEGVAGWTALDNPYQHTLTRLAAAFWDENRRLIGSENYFEDRSDVEVTNFHFGNTRYFADPNDPLNTGWRGRSSYIINDSIQIKDKDTNSGTTTIPDDHHKIIAMEYQIETLPPTGQVYNILKLGETSEPLLALDDGGLVVRVGNQDGAEVSQDRQRVLRTLYGSSTEHIGRIGNVDSKEDADFIVPTSVGSDQFPLDVSIRVEILHNGSSVGSDTQTFTIADRNADQGNSRVTFSISDQPDFETDVSYDYNSDLYGVLNRHEIIVVRPVEFFTDSSLIYVVSMTYIEDISFHRSLTYTDHRINAGLTGTLRGSTGFPPNQYPTDQVHHTNDLLMAFVPTDAGHFTGDPPLTLFIVVNGIIEDAVPLHRTESELDFSDMTFGNEHTDIANVQVYQYSADGLSTRLTDSTLLSMYQSRNHWLNAFQRDADNIGHYILDADLEIQDKLYLSTNTNNRFVVTVEEDGTLTTAAAPTS